jgi:endonuclease/exonuclease/phosphatase family metal-dependent hydrolase
VATTFLCAAAGTVQAQVPTASLLAHWTFDENSGTTANDSTANNNDLTLVNGAAWTSGRINSGLLFDGANDHLVGAPNPSTLQPQRFAVSAWIKFSATDTSGGDIATMGDSYSLRVQPSGDMKVFFYRGGSDWPSLISGGFNAMDGRWHHVVGQYDGATLQIYVDGGLQGNTPASGAIVYPTGRSFHVGKHGNGGGNHDFNGTIDQVRVYGEALSPLDIAALVAEGPPDANRIKVLTWNIHKCRGTDWNGSNANCNRVAEAIHRTGADVALLSAVLPANASAIKTRLNQLGGSWDYHYDQVTTEGQAIFSKHGTTSISGTASHDVLHCGGSESQTIVKATVTIGAHAISFFAVDKDHQFAATRRCQAEAMRNWADDPANNFSQPRIVGGDFNEDTEALGTGKAYWLETYQDDWKMPPSESQRKYPGNTNGRTRNTRLDYILSSQSASGLSVYESRVWDFRDLATSCSSVVTAETLCKCSACGSTIVDDWNVRPSDHIPLTVIFTLQ